MKRWNYTCSFLSCEQERLRLSLSSAMWPLTLFSWWSCVGDNLSFHTRGGSKVVGGCGFFKERLVLYLTNEKGGFRAEIAVRPAARVGWGDAGHPFQTSPYSFLRSLLDLGVLEELTSESRDLDLASLLQHRVKPRISCSGFSRTRRRDCVT